MNVYVFREPESSVATEVVSGLTTRHLSDGNTVDAFITNLKNINAKEVWVIYQMCMYNM